MQLEPQTFPIIDALRARGYAVSLNFDKQSFVATAKDDSGQTWTVRAEEAHAAVVELAEKLGVDVESI